MNEDTIIRTMRLPFGQLWAYYADANVIALSPCLDLVGREDALSAIQAEWRRSGIRALSSDEPNTVRATVPISRLPSAAMVAGS